MVHRGGAGGRDTGFSRPLRRFSPCRIDPRRNHRPLARRRAALRRATDAHPHTRARNRLVDALADLGIPGDADLLHGRWVLERCELACGATRGEVVRDLAGWQAAPPRATHRTVARGVDRHRNDRGAARRGCATACAHSGPWCSRPLWFAAHALVLTPLLLVFSRFERPKARDGAVAPAWRLVAGASIVCLGIPILSRHEAGAEGWLALYLAKVALILAGIAMIAIARRRVRGPLVDASSR